jgi:glycosyltransferase involved in cell wall biosynthesis
MSGVGAIHVPMRVWVRLVHFLDVDQWRRDHAAGLVPDRVPFGLDWLGEHELSVRYEAPMAGHLRQALAARVSGRSERVEWVEAIAAWANGGARTADVILCWDESTGIPTALLGVGRGQPLVMGAQRLTDVAPERQWLQRAASAAVQRCAAVFVQAEAQRPAMSELFGIQRVEFVPFGVDPEWFRPRPGLVVPDRVVSVGHDSHRDHDTLLAAMRIVREMRPAAHLELATMADVSLAPPLGRLHRGSLGPDRQWFYPQAAVVAVAARPNIHGSGMSVVTEAMACGRPYVVTSSPGLAGYVEHGKHGLVVPPGNPEAMATAILELLFNPEQADALGCAGREEVERRLNTREQARVLAELIHRRA